MDKPTSPSASFTRSGTLFGAGHRAPVAAARQRPAWPFQVQSRRSAEPGRSSPMPEGRKSFIS